jgi:triacylglycerol lipase
LRGVIPIVLHHGLFGFGEIHVGRVHLSYFKKIDRAIAARGHPLIVSRVHPTGGIALRARQLKETIHRQRKVLGCERGRVLIIAHSLGGLDARYMISRLGMADEVAGLLTITSPHRGSPYADWCVRHLGRRLGGLQLMQFLGLDVQAIVDLTTESCRQFNQEVHDVAGVPCFSISAARPWHRVPPIAYHSHKVIADAEGPNDGLVSVASSTWASHLGTWPADHWHAINKRLVVELVDRTGDIVPYYLNALDHVLRQCGAAATR